MDPSAEIKNAVLHLYECVSSGDATAVERLFSRSSGVLAIGSDPGEWWADHDTIAQAFKAQFPEMGAPQIKAGELNAFVEGTVGWTSDRRTIRLADGKQIVVRETCIFHKEEGEWKIVQLHASLAIPNEETFAKETAVK